jgi:hypothetical protein
VITDPKCERAVEFLADSDELAAELKVDVERKSHLIDLARNRIFLTETGNNAERTAKAETNPEVIQATDEWLKVYVESEKMRNRRTTADLIIRTWQTASANRRQGHM